VRAAQFAEDLDGRKIRSRDASLVAMTEKLITERLILRRWREADREAFQAINADPRVMEFFPAVLSPRETDEAIVRIEQHFERHGFGLYAAELIEAKTFIGFVGLSVPAFEAPFMPAVEIGWRLAYAHWGRGFATEGAHAVVRHAVETLRLPGLVSFTSTANLRSRRVIENIGMVHDTAADFDHPRLPEGHTLRRHVLYRLHSYGDGK
jgi:RimJ/RimL family protein N-acetyltransferase